MSLTKNVNGVEVVMSDEEAAAIQAEWDANAPTLATWQQDKIASLTNQLNSTIDNAFNHQTRDMFNYLYANANANSMPNRAAYCQQIATWGEQCYQAWAAAISQVNAATDQAGVDAVAMALPAAPSVTLAGAMGIQN